MITFGECYQAYRLFNFVHPSVTSVSELSGLCGPI